MNLTQLISHEPLRWGLPLAVFTIIFSVFNFMDDKTSSEVRSKLTTFIKHGTYEGYLGVLPEIVESTFIKAFGDRHLSKKCLWRSMILSVFSVGVAVTFSAIYNYHDLKGIFSGYGDFMAKFQEGLSKKDETKKMAEVISTLGVTNMWLLLIPVLWVFWCLIPDYISVLKTRIVILVLKNTAVSTLSLVLTIMIDFIISIWVFFANFVIFQMVILYLFVGFSGHWSNSLIVDMFIFGILFTAESALMTMNGVIFFYIPIANIFWASMLSSIWLWTYILSALAARALLASKPVLRRLVYFLDFAEHPIRSLGVVAGAVMATGSGVLLVVLTFIS